MQKQKYDIESVMFGWNSYSQSELTEENINYNNNRNLNVISDLSS